MVESVLLGEDSPAVIHILNRDKRMAKLITLIGPIEYVLPSCYYEFLVSQIVNQMLSNKASDAIFDRLVHRCGGIIKPQSISALSDEEIKAVGLSSLKVNYIRNLTSAIEDGSINFDNHQTMSDNDVIKELTHIKGLGEWSAKMYLLFALNRQDILPFEDVAFLQAYKWLYKTDDTHPNSISKRCKKWKPYSSVAARYLYRALEQGFTKEEFHLYK